MGIREFFVYDEREGYKLKPQEEVKRLIWRYTDLPISYVDIHITNTPEVFIGIDSRELAKEMLKLDKELTNKIQKDFEETGWNTHWKDWREEWIKNNIPNASQFWSGNTYNFDNYYFWGGVFEFTVFDNGVETGIVVQWHLGGDVRGNYTLPEVWFGDVYSFFSMQEFDHPIEELPAFFGYKDYLKLIEDLKQLKRKEE